MKLASIASLLALTSCKTIAAGLGFVPVEVVDGGPPTSLLGIEEAAGVSGIASLLAVVGLNAYRNYTRAKALHSEAPTERKR